MMRILLPWICPPPLGEWGEITSLTKVWLELCCNKIWGSTEIIQRCGWNLYSLSNVCPYFYFIAIVGPSLVDHCVVLNTWLNESHGIRWPFKVQDVYGKLLWYYKMMKGLGTLKVIPHNWNYKIAITQLKVVVIVWCSLLPLFFLMMKAPCCWLPCCTKSSEYVELGNPRRSKVIHAKARYY